MLEQMRQRGASIFIYLIFGLLIVIFVINFAPQGNQPGAGGCRGTSGVIVDVDGDRVNEQAYKVAFSSPFNDQQRAKDPGKAKTHHALDTLIRRELLASEAEERGIRVNKDMVQEEMKKGYFFIGGERMPLGAMIFDQHEDGTRTWNVRKFKGLVQSLNVTQNAFLEEQSRGLQAAMMAELLASSAQVSRNEALNEFMFDRNTVTYDVVAFTPALYREAMLLTDADIERYLGAHEDQVKARHKEKEREYLDRKPQLKLRQIFIEAEKPADPKPDEAKPDGAKPDDAKPADAKPADAKPADAKKPDVKVADAKKPDAKKPDAKKPDVKAAGGKPTVEEARAKLEAAREAVASGKQKFVDLAKQLNTDPPLRANGGLSGEGWGWHTAASASLGDQVVSDAVKDLKPGQMTPVITGERGVYLVYAEAERQGNLTYDQVKHELAAALAREAWSKEAAKRAALAALEKAQASKKSLEDLFPATLQQQLQQQLNEQIEKQGSIVIESPDIPAAWKAGDGAAPAPAGSAAPAPAPAAGSAAPAPAAGAPGSGDAAPAAPRPAPIVASSDVLPAFQDVKPKVRRESSHRRQKGLPGVDAEGVKMLFDELDKGDLAGRVFEADGNYTLVQVVDKAQGTIEDFDKNAERLIAMMRHRRGAQLVRDWLDSRCEELDKAGKIKPREDKIAEYDQKGNPVPTTYRACNTLHLQREVILDDGRVYCPELFYCVSLR